MRRSSATAPALLYLLHPCSRVHPCTRGIPFVLNIKVGRLPSRPTYRRHSWGCGRSCTRE